METPKNLDDIFNDDPFGLLNIKQSTSNNKTADERLLNSFEEINAFYEKEQRAPELGRGIQEMQLHSRLNGIRKDSFKTEMLLPHDRFGLLQYEEKEIKTVDDILDDDFFGLLDEEGTGLYDLKHVPTAEERASADFVARRKQCKDFEQYEPLFKSVQADLVSGKRKLIKFEQDNLRAGEFYVHNGVLLLLEQVDFEETKQEFKSGSRVRKDGRTRIVFENGTESNMLYRSLYKSLLDNGKAISENKETFLEDFQEQFGNIKDEDVASGYIYILQSKSTKEEIRNIKHLYKIGYSTTPINERIKNAINEPTYLMAEVRLISAFKCFNLNPQKLEQLMHNFFGNACLNIDVFDNNGRRHTPREWFIAPLAIIEQVIQLIISGKIINYRYNSEQEIIVDR